MTKRVPPRTTVVVVGAGHSGLAVSQRLGAEGIDHVMLERGEVAHSWRTQRWDSLRLLTPGWMNRLPGLPEPVLGPADDDEFLTAAQVASLVTGYADTISAPVHENVGVERVSPTDDGYLVETSTGPWSAENVVLATGSVRGVTPALAADLPPGLPSVHAIDYRRPSQLPPGGVLVVGAAASGVQIAAELQASGRQVTLAVGEHVRAPRRYRGRDIFAWIDAAGVLDERWDEVEDVVRARRLSSFQLVGGTETLDLNTLQEAGVRVVGKLAGLREGTALFSGSLTNMAALADLKLNRLLNTIDETVGGTGERPEPTRVPAPVLSASLTSGEIRSVVWATGIKPDHSFLDADVFDHKGAIRHDGGVTGPAGLYVTGLPVLRRRRSTYIDGARADSADLVSHLTRRLADPTRRTAG
ncbi:putative flavoprotein involved in K+ transport [Nocardioides albertanoniae]|uniref:Putative flavoprotein involved in K+ transport n=1 Tax=Nocardioides albertanoniae TaxID=1175486 RepID=A0A543AB20_9ACTN|nr:NAD(P)-binding domain-containing protein [Nocardioides albertanoniae]TQL69710.1 putative flavoprotein involved in K+ transport [Nocardioides albertanoniae]